MNLERLAQLAAQAELRGPEETANEFLTEVIPPGTERDPQVETFIEKLVDIATAWDTAKMKSLQEKDAVLIATPWGKIWFVPDGSTVAKDSPHPRVTPRRLRSLAKGIMAVFAK